VPNTLIPSPALPSTARLSPHLFYRIVAIAEAITWTLLISGLLLKYLLLPGEAADAFTSVAGFLHGMVFISYGMTAVLVGVNQHWKPGLIVFAVITAIIPFDLWLDRKGRLTGDWRRTKTDDPRDSGWVSAVLRWLLNRPVLLGTLFIVGLAAIMTTLLIVGPPGGE
jgi:integral membrane protein